MDINQIHTRVNQRIQADEKLHQEALEAYEIKKRQMVEEIVREHLASNNVLSISVKDFDKIVQQVLNRIAVR